MYEAQFGLNGPPFQLNPDPSFYFDSRGHSHALAYLRFGVHQGEGFIVVTGEVGAGKTTLVRTLLEGLDSNEVVAAQVLNTQLESGELLQSILTAFGVASQEAQSKARLLASLEAFLTAVASQGRRALLVIDEAQNLGSEAIEEIRMLSNFQLGNHALLQSFLIGQPELRKQLESRAMEQLRQRVLASCHLGPLTQEETRAYIEHRLRHVGWSGYPAFDDPSFASIYGWTGGIPRKINLLCNRLLLAAFLGEKNAITVDLVENTGRELIRETGGARALPEPALPTTWQQIMTPTTTDDVARVDKGNSDVIQRGAMAAVEYVPRTHAKLDDLLSPVICVADSPLSYLKFAVLAKVLITDHAMPPLVLLNPGEPADVQADQLPADLLEAVGAELHLGVKTGSIADQLAALSMRFGDVLDRLLPTAVITSGDRDAVLHCAYLSRKRSMPLARLGAGQRRDMQTMHSDLNAVLMDRMADILYTPMLKTHYALYREGIPADRMVCIGNVLVDGLRQIVSAMPPVSELLRGLGLSRDQLRRALRGFALVTAQVEDGDLVGVSDVSKVARVARDLGKETLVLWSVTEATSRAIADGKGNMLLQRSGVVLVPRTGYSDQIGLVRGATCVIAGPNWGFVEEADCLDIPCIVLHPGGEVPAGSPGGVIAKIPCDSVACVRALHEILERGRPDDEIGDDAAGAAGARLLEHLRRWLPMRSLRAVPGSGGGTHRAEAQS